MATDLQFDDAINRALKMAYLTPEIVDARAKVVQALQVRVGQKVLDIGSGPGLLASDIAKRVGEVGAVVGIDLADNMLNSARELCADTPWVTFEQADAMLLPFDDNSFDAVVSTQVYEYVPDLEAALVEFARVLRPGGHGVIVDTDWAFPYWNAVDFTLHDRMVKAWKGHCMQESVPLRLAAAIKSAGLQLVKVQALPISNTVYDENGFSFWLSSIIKAFAVGRNGIEKPDADRWIKDLHELGRKGEYFFCINRYLFEITK
ncbi:MAG: methyltransferase domain-containing protein [Cycloclasticus sp.]|nr:methyltransferase domain-containing protein [Cycloclasticus sp.]